MSGKPMSIDDEFHREIQALVSLVRASIRLRTRAVLSSDHGPLRLKIFTDANFERILSRRQIFLKTAAKKPVLAALNYAIRSIGEQIYQRRQRHEDMLNVSDIVAGRMKEKSGLALAILDKRWDGIGDWLA